MVKLAKFLPNHDLENLESIPGFAQTIAVRILAELGDIRRFSSPNKINEVIEGKGVKANYHDQTAFVGSNRLLADVNISQEMNQQATKLQEEAKTVVYVGLNGEIIGLIAIQDVPKPSSKEAISELKKRGLKTVMLTGDNEKVAQAIANEVGIDQVIAGVLPNEKAEHIQELQQNGNKVAFVGDGINDAPALSTADVGIAMGSGTDIAIDSGGIVLAQNPYC